jgi:hypothetical protein
MCIAVFGVQDHDLDVHGKAHTGLTNVVSTK